ncbi:MAG TPA: TSUP family transporter [Planctomycetota bacterium]|nr:TSUP family transporter [Planctomycetota bacterium]
MLDPKTVLLLVLALIGAAFIVFWAWALRRAHQAGASVAPTPYELLVGFVTDFFDTLGIGSFATTTSLYRARAAIDDRLLPGTLNVGHALPTVVQAFIFIKGVKVETTTLVLMIAAAVAGALLGAPIVARWPRQRIQFGMGLALLVLCSILIYRQFTDPAGGTDEGLQGAMLAIGVVGNFALGALMTIGIGLYAPCLVLVCLLGMNQRTGFPIMMGSCAFLMPLASVPFVRQASYAPRAALGLTLAGVPAVLIAGLIVEELPLYWVKWIVAVVVVYTALNLLRAARLRPA